MNIFYISLHGNSEVFSKIPTDRMLRGKFFKARANGGFNRSASVDVSESHAAKTLRAALKRYPQNVTNLVGRRLQEITIVHLCLSV